jgi:glutathione S-transferase
MYKLHGFCQSGNSFKVAFFLRALGQPFEPVFVDFMNGVTRTEAWRQQSNEMGEAPVLDEDGRLMTQSAAILLHLAHKHGAFGGRSDDERQEVLRWLFFDNHKFTSYFASYRFIKAFGTQAPDPAVMAWLRARIDAAFGIVDKHLARRAYMLGGAPTVADFSLCGYLFYPQAESGIDIAAQFPNIAPWIERMRAIAGWASPYDVLPGERIAPRW